MKSTFYLTPTPISVAQGLQHAEEKRRRMEAGENLIPDPDMANGEINTLRQAITDAGGRCFLSDLLTDSPDEVFRQDVGYAAYDFSRNKNVYIRFPMGAQKRSMESRPFFEYMVNNHAKEFDEFVYWSNRGGQAVSHPKVKEYHHKGTAEGGDLFPPIIVDGQPTVVVGLRQDNDDSNPVRTTPDGANGIKSLLEGMGYRVIMLNFWNTLHLTTIGSMIGFDRHGKATVMIDHTRCDWQKLANEGFRVLKLPDNAQGQEWGLNAIRVGNTLIIQAGYPAIEEMLYSWSENQITIVKCPWKELRKVDGSFTCAAIFSGMHR